MPSSTVRGPTICGNAPHVGSAQASRESRSPSRVGSLGLAAFTVVTAVATVGCKCESSNKHPFTPFGVATEVRAVTGPSSGDGVTTGETSAPSFKRVAGQLVNPPTPMVRVGDWEVKAPDNLFFAQYVATNLNDEPGLEVVAWLVSGSDPSTGKPGRAEPLVLFQKDRPPKTLAQYPTFVPRSEGCSLQTDLSATGPHTVTWDVGAVCPAGTLIPRSPYRSLAILAPLHPNPVRLHLRLAEPIPGERLEVAVDTGDIDGDAHDDAALTFRLSATESDGGSNAAQTKAQPAEARLLWLDRAAGMARDNAEPKKSFTGLGNLELVRAKGPNTSRLVPRRIDHARRLFAYLCKESATFRVTDVDGAPITCGELAPAFDAWVAAEVTAALTQRHYARAVLAFEQAAWFGGGTSPKANKSVEKLLRDAIATRAVTGQTLETKATTPPPGPHYSPLRYVEETLFVITPQGVQRFRGGTLEDASDEVDPWTLVAFGPEAQRLSQLAFPCNEATLFAASQTNTGNFGTALQTDILSPRPGVCEGRGSTPEVEFRPIAWTREGLSCYVGPVALGPAPSFRQPGSPQSNNGNWAISVGKLGILVQTPQSAEFWSVPAELAGLSDCVISDSGASAACLQGSKVVVLTPAR